MADASKLLRSLLFRAYKMTDTDIDAVLDDQTSDDDGIKQLTELDKTRIIEIKKNKSDKTYEDGYKKAKEEVTAEFDKSIKDKYGIESDASGLDLIAEVATKEIEASGKNKDITEDDVKRHATYQTLERTLKKSLKEKDDEWAAKFNQRELDYKKAESFDKVKAKANSILNELNPILPGTANVADTLKNTFFDAFKGYDYDIQGDNIVILKDGKVVDDGHGNSLDFSQLVKSTASNFFEFKANNGGGNAGNGKPGEQGQGGGNGGDGYPTGIQKPKTWDEVVKIANDTTIKAEDRSKVVEVWQQEQAGQQQQ